MAGRVGRPLLGGHAYGSTVATACEVPVGVGTVTGVRCATDAPDALPSITIAGVTSLPVSVIAPIVSVPLSTIKRNR